MAFQSSYFQKRFGATSRDVWALPGLLNSSCICYLHFGLIYHPFCKDDNSTERKFKPNDKQQPAKICGEKAFYTSRLSLRPIYLLGVWSSPLGSASFPGPGKSSFPGPGNEVVSVSGRFYVFFFKIAYMYKADFQIHVCTQPKINYLWLQMARMEMDGSLEKMTFFKFFLCILKKYRWKLNIVCSSFEKSLSVFLFAEIRVGTVLLVGVVTENKTKYFCWWHWTCSPHN